MTENDNSQNQLAKHGVLKVDFSDEKTLYDSYMPFVKGCGLFIPGNEQHQMGDEAFLLLTLPGEQEQFAVPARIVWLNPKQKLGKRVPGVGLQILGQNATIIKEKIEHILGKKVGSPLPTATL